MHLIDTGGPGGAESLCLQLATESLIPGTRSTAIVSREGWLSTRLRERGIPPHILPSDGSFNIRYLLALTDVLRRQKAIALLTHLYGSAVYGCMAGMALRLPVVSVLHGQTDIADLGRFQFGKAMALRHGASRIVFVSDQLKNDVACKLRLPDFKCVVIHNGIDVDKYVPRRDASMRVSLGLGAEDILIGALGNIRKPKAYDVLLDAAHLICREYSNVYFVIAGQGSGALLNELLTQRARLNLERRVHFIGFCSNVQEFLNGIDIYALSSTTEGFSISCIEAMACSVPVVATRSGGPETIVSPGESGLLVRPGSATDLADALRQLLASPELRAKLGTSGRSRVLSSFDSKLMMNQYRTLLVDAIGSSSKLSDSLKDR